MCGLFKRNCLGLQQPPLQTDFCSQKLWGLIFLALEPWTGDLVWGRDSSLPRYPSRMFTHHTWVWDQPIRHLRPSHQSGWMWFL